MSGLPKETSTELSLTCDGCWLKKPVNLTVAMGYQMRYCDECKVIFEDFVKATAAIGAKYQRMLDAEEIEVRLRCPLIVTPLDLPKLLTDKNGEAITLG